jgi:hypothetical protein
LARARCQKNRAGYELSMAQRNFPRVVSSVDL